MNFYVFFIFLPNGRNPQPNGKIMLKSEKNPAFFLQDEKIIVHLQPKNVQVILPAQENERKKMAKQRFYAVASQEGL